jgi:Zn-finger nucleic acid-binding protein
MHCPECSTDLTAKKLKGLDIQTCPNCQGMFILQEELKIIEKDKDPEVAWLDLELWRHREKYEAGRGNLSCPSCSNFFHALSYPNSNVQIQVCHECRAVWLNEKMLQELHQYLEKRITSETVVEYLKDLGHESLEVLKGKENLKTLGVILKLLQYRIFTNLPFIKNMIQNLPKV